METTDQKRIIIADDHAVVRSAIQRLLEEDPAIRIVGVCSNGSELIDMLQKEACDLVVLDLSMPGMDGLRALDFINKYFRTVKALILSMHADADSVRKCMRKRAAGYILKEDAYGSLLEAVHTILNGGFAISPQLSGLLNGAGPPQPERTSVPVSILTQRQKEVLALIGRGMSNREVADALAIGPRTVESHRASLMRKVHARNVADLVKYAVENNQT